MLNKNDLSKLPKHIFTDNKTIILSATLIFTPIALFIIKGYDCVK